MNWLDIGILVFLIASLIRGLEIGFVRQFCSTAGFLSGLLLGAWLQSRLVTLVDTPGAKALLAIVVVLGCALLLMTAGEYLGLRLKFKMKETNLINRIDRILGSVVASVTILVAVWLGAAIFRGTPNDAWQQQINDSRVVSILNDALPPAPDVISQLGHLLNPNVFPQVFTGLEPELQTDAPLPDLGDLNTAVQSTRDSVVKIQGMGCGGVVTGSGFVADAELIITNAHVVAGVGNLEVVDVGGARPATVVWFDPNLDLAILRAENLAGRPLKLDTELAAKGTAAITPGYPENQGFTVKPATVMDTFIARGRDIYDKHETERQVYAVNADVRQGNSGGPLIAANGSVIGVVFAQSTTYDRVGYAFTIDQAVPALNSAGDRYQAVQTGSCAR